jgi:hypothetical protein
MYCSACGKKCPEGAVFCAWCGARLPELEPGEAVSAPQPEDIPAVPDHSAPQPEAEKQPVGEAQPAFLEPDPLDLDLDEDEPDEPGEEAPAQHPFQRPQAYSRADDAHTVRPLSVNPAQPLRGAEAVKARASEAAEELQPEEPDLLDEEEAPVSRHDRKTALAREDGEGTHSQPNKPGRFGQSVQPAKRSLFGWRNEKPAKRSPYEREDEKPAKHSPYEREDEKPVKRSPYEREDEKPAKRSPYEREDEKSAKRSPYEREGDQPARRSPYGHEDDRPAKRAPLEREGDRPKHSPHEHEDDRPAKRSPYDREEQRPLKHALIDADDDMPVRPARDRADRPKATHGKAVTASGGMVTPPARRSPAKHSGPFRPKQRSGKDIFFEDLETPAENFYDEAVEERALSRRIKGIVTVALLAGALMVAIWLMWTPGGQMVRAQLNLGAPASAYKALGDQDRAGGQVQRAADAYYNALKLDPKNYDYALLVGQTQEMTGNRESAAKAYMLCVTLKPTEVQPYKLLVDLYRVMGDNDAAENWRAEGYKQTADASLAPGT